MLLTAMLLAAMLLTNAVVAVAVAAEGSISHPAAVVHAGAKYTLTNVSGARRQIADRNSSVSQKLARVRTLLW